MERLNIFKIGGNVIDDADLLDQFLQDLCKVDGKKLLVHGGGKIATKMASSLGIETEMREGRRITTDEMIDVVLMTYGGLVNKKIVARIQSLGTNAIGLTGADGDVIRSDKRPVQNGVDFGWVGDPKAVNVEWLIELITETLPVMAPLTHDGNGHMLNTNADTIANTLAIALSKKFRCELNYCFELDGVLKDINDPDSLIKELTQNNYASYRNEGVISNGMIPKLDNAFNAISSGVERVRIIHHKKILKLKDATFDGFTNIH